MICALDIGGKFTSFAAITKWGGLVIHAIALLTTHHPRNHQNPHRLAPCGFTISVHSLSPLPRGGKRYRLIKKRWYLFPFCRRGIARAALH